MNPTVAPLTFTVPLGLEAHRLAQKFCQHQVNARKAKQVYLNTLAVWAVNFYLQCMEIETFLEASESWNPGMQTIMDVADLEVPNFGKLECRPVLPDAQVVQIPPEVQENRFAYVAVRMSESLKEGEILGFAKTVSGEELPISELHSLEEMLEYLSQIQPVNLGQWLQKIFEPGWQTVKELLASEEVNLAFRFRGDSVQRGKLIDLGIQQAGQSVVIVVKLTPESEEAESEEEMDVLVEVHPPKGQTYLPPNLQLKLLNEDGEAVLEAKASSENKNIQLEFSGEPGDRFSVNIVLGDVSVTENFVI